MAGRLEGKKVAILVTDGFEQVEMTEPRRALDDAGIAVDDLGLRRPTLDEVFLVLTGQPLEAAEPERRSA